MKAVAVLLCVLGVVLGEDVSLQEFTDGNHVFTANFHKEVVSSVLNHKGNLIASPFSAVTVLALTELGAKGETASEMRTGLKLPSTDEKTKQAFKTLLPQIQGNDKFSLDTANRIYVKEGFTIRPEYQDLATSVFQASLQNIDFKENVKAAKTINEWVEEKTHDKIKDLVKPDQLTAYTKLVLVNAIYFKANWSKQFDTYSTHDAEFFTTEKESTKVPTMHTTSYFNYYECKELNAKFLELEYEGGEAKMTIVLPNEKEGLVALESKLDRVFAPRNFTLERVAVSLPKFTVESELELVPVLKNLGIKKVFSDSESDLSGIADVKDILFVSDVIQKAFINVTEAGTEAAAATAVMVNFSSFPRPRPQPPKEFIVDHPFLFTITHKFGILFNGRIVLPKA